MIDYKKTMLAVLGLWAFAPSAFCQNNGVWIGASSSAGDFPASNSTAMAAAPTGDFHTGIVSVGEMESLRGLFNIISNHSQTLTVTAFNVVTLVSLGRCIIKH